MSSASTTSKLLSKAFGDPFAAFGDSERTVIKPGADHAAVPARRDDTANGAPSFGPSGSGTASDTTEDGSNWPADSRNPLVAAAMPLLAAAPRIRRSARHPDATALRQALADAVQAFDVRAHAHGLPHEQIVAARYVLCTLLDESVAATPWGGAGGWSVHSLLVQFHNESWGGEKVFQLMSRLAVNVQANRNLLELMYLTLAFGFEGRYRRLPDGRAQLSELRTRLAHVLRDGRSFEPDLSPRWQTRLNGDEGLRRGVPWWVAAAGTGVLLLLVFLAFRIAINRASDPVFDTLHMLGSSSLTEVAAGHLPPPAPLSPAASATVPRLGRLLTAEIRAGQMQVLDMPDRSIVVMQGDGLFEPGSAEVTAIMRPALERLADALQQIPGAVLVTGHTDNQPIRSLRFPSNWHLSQARAAAVRSVLAERVDTGRLRTEGRADSQPAADNTGAEGRARNRRVEVTLFVRTP